MPGFRASACLWRLQRLHPRILRTDRTEDLKKFDVPTLIQGDDQIVPIGASGFLSSKIVKGATLKIYPGAPTGCAQP